jgi:hypothetical protein
MLKKQKTYLATFITTTTRLGLALFLKPGTVNPNTDYRYKQNKNQYFLPHN